jgi:tetratricopeptide (TPR) repeat protein
MLECTRETEGISERLNDDRRRGRVSPFLINNRMHLGELDEALACGTRALEVARRLEDSGLHIITMSYLTQAYYYRADYEHVVESATNTLEGLPAAWVNESFGLPATAAVYLRVWLVMSLAELGRFPEAAECEAEAIRLAEPTEHAYTLCVAHRAGSTLQILKGDWVTARSLAERWIAVARTWNVDLHIPFAVTSSAWVLAQLGEASEALKRLREGRQGVDGLAARGRILLSWEYHALGRACLLLGQLDEARRLADRAMDLSPHQPGLAARALHLLGDIATYPDRFDADRGEAHYRQALALAEPRGMRPLIAHCHLSLGQLYRRTGQREQAQEYLSTATTMYREMGMTYWLEKAEMEIAEFER